MDQRRRFLARPFRGLGRQPPATGHQPLGPSISAAGSTKLLGRLCGRRTPTPSEASPHVIPTPAAQAADQQPGQAARRNSQGLAQFNSTFTQQSPQTQATIGGSAQSKDRTMIASINKVKVHAAADALQRT